MWVRSQNEKALCNCNQFAIEYFKSHYWIQSEYGALGKYSTERQALIVLDELQDMIENIRYLETSNFGVKDFVFQMPLNKEVQEDGNK